MVLRKLPSLYEDQVAQSSEEQWRVGFCTGVPFGDDECHKLHVSQLHCSRNSR